MVCLNKVISLSAFRQFYAMYITHVNFKIMMKMQVIGQCKKLGLDKTKWERIHPFSTTTLSALAKQYKFACLITN